MLLESLQKQLSTPEKMLRLATVCGHSLRKAVCGKQTLLIYSIWN